VKQSLHGLFHFYIPVIAPTVGKTVYARLSTVRLPNQEIGTSILKFLANLPKTSVSHLHWLAHNNNK